MNFLNNLFRRRTFGALEDAVKEINGSEPEMQKLSDEELTAESFKLREEVKNGATLEDIKVRAFALAREAARRTLGQRAYDVQLMGGLVIHQGAVAEMGTGEGKTLSGVAPAYLNALSGEGVHVVTVNEYLARRDAVWMGQVYRLLGVSVACLVPNAAFLYDSEWKVDENAEALIDAERDETGSFRVQKEFLRPVSRREGYLADITYGTNHEFGFDYLRDNLAYGLTQQVQRGHAFAIIDEVDSILIDEARTPLIISAPDTESSELYKTFTRVVSGLVQDEDYTVDEKRKQALVTDAGIAKVERIVGIPNLYAPENLRMVHYLEECLKAKALFHLDRDYVVRNGEIIIVDEFTGRMLQGRRYNGGLHQAIEAKEGVKVQEESRTYGKISIQNYFRMYRKIAGMTGTAQTSAEEFHKVYTLEVVSIPPNRPTGRVDAEDLIYKTAEAKWKAVVAEVKARHEKGQPVLLGTTSISKNEMLSDMLSRAHVPHQVLNAKRNEEEGAIIAQAGRLGKVTVATNIAGRGVDIILGGNPPVPEEAEAVRELGGLCVIGTERHEARRIDNQLRGRTGRQGDPGYSQFFLSLEDDLLRIFGGDKVKAMMERFDLPEDQPIQLGIVSKAVAQAQSKVEGANFDIRKHLLEYDDVLNRQRIAVYNRRQALLTGMNAEALGEMLFEGAYKHLEALRQNGFAGAEGDSEAAAGEMMHKAIVESGIAKEGDSVGKGFEGEELKVGAGLTFAEDYKDLLRRRSIEAAADPLTLPRMLSMLDLLWMNHLDDLEALQESIGLRAYAQHDPLIAYREEARRLYDGLWNAFNEWVFSNIFKLAQLANSGQSAGSPQAGTARPSREASAGTAGGVVTLGGSALPSGILPSGGAASSSGDVGRNDPCPCGSGKKWKKCGLVNSLEHQRTMAGSA